MSMRFSSYISFPGNAEEALTHYHEIFGGNLTIQKYGDVPLEGMPFTPPEGAVAHGQIDGPVPISGGDSMAENPDPLDIHNYSFLLSFDSVEEATAVIEKFTSTGGTVAMPFEKAPWGDHYGQVEDRFGVLWSFDVPAPRGE